MTYAFFAVASVAKVEQNSGMGKFRKGSQKPVASGRKRGTPNKKTLVLSESLEALELDVSTRLNELLLLLTYEKQADVLLELMTFQPLALSWGKVKVTYVYYIEKKKRR